MTDGAAIDAQRRFMEEVIERLRAVAAPTRVILFGSMATGDATADSDLDLLVLFEAVADPRRESVLLREALGDIGMPVDVIVMTTARFEETKDVIGGIAYPANKYGTVIYEAA
ncbi:MAG: nucleotidyltransferase domain-containing protein [Armatimonadetes bacterium]|nr:nucleotidyltransferase domain-containing protein [Armatimonadota bacterium]